MAAQVVGGRTGNEEGLRGHLVVGHKPTFNNTWRPPGACELERPPTHQL